MIGFVALALVLYFVGRDDSEVPVAAPPVLTEAPTQIKPKPKMVTGQQAVKEPDQPVVEVPAVPSVSPLTDSDDEVTADLHALSESEEWHKWTETEDVIRKFSVVLDNLAAGAVALKPFPIPTPKPSFQVQYRDNRIYLDPKNYARFTPYVDVIRKIDADQLTDLYRKYLPLLEQAYAELDDVEGDVDKRVVASLDILLSTPEVKGDVQLLQKGGNFLFRDPALEALPAVQKQLIRMGPENARVIREKAAQLKQALEN